MVAVDVSAVEREARARVDKVADDPAGRVQLRREFYRKFGFADRIEIPTEFGFGSSEIEFLRWEAERGVLNPVNGTPNAGSSWWRNVNSDFLYHAELGGLAHERGVPASEVPAAAQAWMEYIAQPSPKSWYRAHNSSIVTAYLARLPDALREQRPEQLFMNVVLYRLLYAQGLVEGIEMGRLGELLANPDLPSVDVLVHLPDFYPRDYPLTPADARHVMHRGHSAEELAAILLDDVCIIPHLTPLYCQAAVWAGCPGLTSYVIDGEPVYPTRIPRPWHERIWLRATLLLDELWRTLTRA